MSEAPCLSVPKILGEKAISLARRLALFSKNLKVHKVGDYLCIPLVAEPHSSHVDEFKRNLPEFEVTVHSFPEQVERRLKLIDRLGDKLPPHLLASLPRAMDFVGDIAIVEVPSELESYRELIGNAIMTVHKNVKTVLGKAGAVEGTYRLRAFEVLAGRDKTETVHREFGCVYHVDLAKAYFSPRLSHEHDRVASQVQKDETVVDMFAGVGPFSILTAKRCKNAKIFAIDANPDAIQLLRRNIYANNVEEAVTPILGDVREVVKEGLVGIADRVLMNLPEAALDYVDVACEFLKPSGGIMHYYEFASAPNPLDGAKVRLVEGINKTDCSVDEILLARRVRATAPYAWQVVVDAKIK